MHQFRMTKRYHSGMYHYLGKYGNICTDRDTGAERDKFMFEIGQYMSAENVRLAQLTFFRYKFPTLTDQELEIKIRKAEELAR